MNENELEQLEGWMAPTSLLSQLIKDYRSMADDNRRLAEAHRRCYNLLLQEGLLGTPVPVTLEGLRNTLKEALRKVEVLQREEEVSRSQQSAPEVGCCQKGRTCQAYQKRVAAGRCPNCDKPVQLGVRSFASVAPRAARPNCTPTPPVETSSSWSWITRRPRMTWVFTWMPMVP